MRSDARTDLEHYSVQASYRDSARGRLANATVDEALAGRDGVRIYDNHSGKQVLGAFGAAAFGTTRWALCVEQQVDEALAPVHALRHDAQTRLGSFQWQLLLVAAATAAVSFHRGRPVHAFLVRKEAKGHGTAKYVEGRNSLPDGSAVCVVEDTTTTGGSLLQAVDRATAEGLRVVQCLTIVDREEGAAAAIAARGLPFTSLIRRSELEA